MSEVAANNTGTKFDPNKITAIRRDTVNNINSSLKEILTNQGNNYEQSYLDSYKKGLPFRDKNNLINQIGLQAVENMIIPKTYNKSIVRIQQGSGVGGDNIYFKKKNGSNPQVIIAKLDKNDQIIVFFNIEGYTTDFSEALDSGAGIASNYTIIRHFGNYSFAYRGTRVDTLFPYSQYKQAIMDGSYNADKPFKYIAVSYTHNLSAGATEVYTKETLTGLQGAQAEAYNRADNQYKIDRITSSILGARCLNTIYDQNTDKPYFKLSQSGASGYKNAGLVYAIYGN